MGLDGVELVMEVEDRFKIRLPDAEVTRVRTVADRASLVIFRLPKASGKCLTARSFYELRKLLVEHGGLNRSQVRPRARLDVLLPARGRNSIWRRLATHEPRLSRLTVPPCTETVFGWIAFVLGTGWVLAVLAGMLRYGFWWAIPAGVCSLAMGMRLYYCAKHRFERDLPPDIQTVGDLARNITPIEFSTGNSARDLMAEKRVLEEVRRMTAQQLGLPLDRILPESNFVRDLGMD